MTTYTATGTGGGSGNSLALDGSGNIWVTSGPALKEMSSGGGALSPATTGYTGSNNVFSGSPTDPAIDSSGNLWVIQPGKSYQLVEFVGIATPVKTPLSVALTSPNHLATAP